MKRSFIGILSLAILSLATMGAYAQSAVQATVPFAFRVGLAHLPAGTYKITRGPNSNFITLSNAKAGVSAMALSRPDSPAKKTGKLVFLHVGNQYALTRIWGDAGSQGLSIRAPKMDTEKVAASVLPSQTGNEVLIALK